MTMPETSTSEELICKHCGEKINHVKLAMHIRDGAMQRSWCTGDEFDGYLAEAVGSPCSKWCRGSGLTYEQVYAEGTKDYPDEPTD